MRRQLLTVLVATLLSSTAAAQEPSDSQVDSVPQASDDGEIPVVDEEISGTENAVPASEDELIAGAETAFSDGDYDTAIRLLEEAYTLGGNPNMLYNIARVQEEKGDLDGALDHYRRFVLAPDVDLDYRREALESSSILEQRIAERDAKLEPPVPETTQANSDHHEAAPPQGELLRPAPFPSTSAMRPLGFTLAGIGGAALLVGGGLGLAALNNQDKIDEAGTLAERRAAGARTHDLATAADALYISGAVLIVTGLITAFASPERERDNVSSLGLTVTRHGMGAAWSLQF